MILAFLHLTYWLETLWQEWLSYHPAIYIFVFSILIFVSVIKKAIIIIVKQLEYAKLCEL